MVAPRGGRHGCLGVCVWLLWGGMCGFSGGHAWLLGGACVVAGGWGVTCVVALGGRVWLLWGACVVAPGGVHAWSRGHAWLLPGGHAWDKMRYGATVNERAVHILLECILV